MGLSSRREEWGKQMAHSEREDMITHPQTPPLHLQQYKHIHSSPNFFVFFLFINFAIVAIYILFHLSSYNYIHFHVTYCCCRCILIKKLCEMILWYNEQLAINYFRFGDMLVVSEVELFCFRGFLLCLSDPLAVLLLSVVTSSEGVSRALDEDLSRVRDFSRLFSTCLLSFLPLLLSLFPLSLSSSLSLSLVDSSECFEVFFERFLCFFGSRSLPLFLLHHKHI